MENRFFSFDEPRPYKLWIEAMGATKEKRRWVHESTDQTKNFLRRSVP